MGKVCDLDGRDMTVSEKYFHAVMLPAPQSGNFPNPFCDSFDEVMPIQTNKLLRYEETRAAGRREKQRSRMQECKDKDFLHPCTLE